LYGNFLTLRFSFSSQMVCVGFKAFTAPTEFETSSPKSVRDAKQLAADQHRCGSCTATFPAWEGLAQHCREKAHSPVYDTGDSDHSPAPAEEFISYVNLVLQRAMGERLKKWGKDYVDPNRPPFEGQGVRVFEAISLNFGLLKKGEKQARLALTCDLRAKVIRTQTVWDAIYAKHEKGQPFSKYEQRQLENEWIGQVVIYVNDKKCKCTCVPLLLLVHVRLLTDLQFAVVLQPGYTVTGLKFDQSPDSLPIPDKGISHTQYFASKGIKLEHSQYPPLIEVEGRRKQSIYLPAEMVCGKFLHETCGRLWQKTQLTR
jgi:hypothetical protein